MGQTLDSIQNAINGLSQDINATLTALTNTIHGLQGNASGTINRLTTELTETLRTVTAEAQQTTLLFRNAFLAIMTAMALSVLLYLTNFSPFLRFMVWAMYACLCLHMFMTYMQHSSRRMLPNLQEQGMQGSLIKSKFLEQINGCFIFHIENIDFKKMSRYKYLSRFFLLAATEYRNDRLQSKIAQSQNLTDIDLLGNKLNDDDMEIVISQAINQQHCIHLRLTHNQFTFIGASILADALTHNSTLERLSLWKNQIGDKGVQSLSDALSCNRNALKKLDLSENEITNHGAEYLAQMLRTNTVLTHLSLSHNKITDHGLQFLTDALRNRNKTLQTLSLTQNKLLTDTSVTYLIEMFKTNRSLKKLWINDCNLSKAGRDELRRGKPIDFELYT